MFTRTVLYIRLFPRSSDPKPEISSDIARNESFHVICTAYRYLSSGPKHCVREKYTLFRSKFCFKVTELIASRPEGCSFIFCEHLQEMSSLRAFNGWKVKCFHRVRTSSLVGHSTTSRTNTHQQVKYGVVFTSARPNPNNFSSYGEVLRRHSGVRRTEGAYQISHRATLAATRRGVLVPWL